MYARLRALCCLLCVGVAPAWAVSSPETGQAVVVYLKAGPLQPHGPLDHLQRELGGLMAAAGYRVGWMSHPGQNVADAELVVVELRGTCALPAGALETGPIPSGGLASTQTFQGRVLPFSWVNCDSLTRTIAPALAAEPAARRDFLYGRALARLVAHELYHILCNRAEHDREGIAKAGFSSRDLLSERFVFESETVTRLERSAPVAADTTADLPSGRQY